MEVAREREICCFKGIEFQFCNVIKNCGGCLHNSNIAATYV